ncbi:hypothetical protein LTS07_011478 [Exophiala sideris]|nr:hypothetical protein LTS07_011478 [Exophiala sideris]KAK5174845.1 hypothetical protein LTR44_011546 [Eurotiomycetes sp. CCFEE 6388]
MADDSIGEPEADGIMDTIKATLSEVSATMDEAMESVKIELVQSELMSTRVLDILEWQPTKVLQSDGDLKKNTPRWNSSTRFNALKVLED